MCKLCDDDAKYGHLGLPTIYVASRASVPERPAMWRALRAEGALIVSSWIDESGQGETADFSELWERIESEIRSAERLVLYVEAEDFPLKGALVEVGIAIGQGKPVWVVAPGVELNVRDLKPLGSWSKHPCVRFSGSVREALGLELIASAPTSLQREELEPQAC